MAGTIAIPGTKRKFPKTAVYIAGAGVAGFVGYAWFTKGSSETPTAPAEEIPEPVEPPTDTPGFTATVPGQGPPISNADWGELAVERLINIGLSGPAVSSAIGKFLQKKPLTAIEADLVQQAIRAAGYPPQGGPWSVIAEPLPPPVAAQPVPGTVRNLRASSTRTQITASWDYPSSAGETAIKFHVEFYGGAAGGGSFVVSSTDVISPTAKSVNTLRPNHPYGVRVRAHGANGKIGAFVQLAPIYTKK